MVCEFGKFGYTLKIEAYEKYTYFHFRHAWECLMWRTAIDKSLTAVHESERALNKSVKYNMDLIYKGFFNKKEQDIIIVISFLTEDLSLSLKVSDFIKELVLTTNKIKLFMDSFYAYRPFSINLLNFVVFHFHKKVRLTFNSYWNNNWMDFNAKDIINYIEAIDSYEKSINSWGVTDEKLNGWVPPLLLTFMTKLFNNCKGIIANILYEARNDYFMVNQKVQSRVSDKIEEHITFIFNHFGKVKKVESAELLLDLCGNVLTVFFINIKEFLRKENFPLQIYMAFINNGFIRAIKNFKRKVFNMPKQELKMKKIKEIIKEDRLINMIVDIEKLCQIKVDQYFSKQINLNFHNDYTFLEFDFKSLLPNLLKELRTTIKLIDNEYVKEEINSKIFETLTNCYYRLFLKFTSQIYLDDYSKAVSKIEGDITLLSQELSKTEINETEKVDLLFKLNQLKLFLSSTDVDEVIICIMNMNVFYKDLITLENIEKLLNAKIFFPAECISYMNDYLKEALFEFEVKSKRTTTLFSTFTNMPLAKKFITNLSRLKRKGGK